MDIRVDYWRCNVIRFVEVNGEWYAVLKDICDALGLANPSMVRSRIPLRYMEKADVCDLSSNEVTSRERHSQTMIVVNSKGIYHAFLGSRKLEAQKFVEWMMDTIDNVRESSGYEQNRTMSFAEDKSKELGKSTKDIIQEHVDAAWRMRYWYDDKWYIEYSDGEYVSLEEYVDEFVPEEIQDEVFEAAYKAFGGQC